MKDEELYHNEWISLRKIAVPSRSINGHVYSTETRCNGKIIAILPYRFIGNTTGIEFLLRREVTPCWEPFDPVLSSITGGWEQKGKTQVAVDEMLEETGYIISPDELTDLGNSYASKSADTVYQLYAVNLTGKEQGEATGEDSTPETHNTSVWVDKATLLQCMDPQVAVLYLRLLGTRKI